MTKLAYLLLLFGTATVILACRKPNLEKPLDHAPGGKSDVIRVVAGAPGDRPTASQIEEAIRLAHELLRQKSLLTGWTLVDTTDRNQIFPRISDQLALSDIRVTGVAKKEGVADVPWSCIMTVRGSEIEWYSIDIEGTHPHYENRDGIPLIEE